MGIFSDPWKRAINQGASRVSGYARLESLYEGQLVRERMGFGAQVRKAAWNFAKPVARFSASFLAGKGIEWRVAGDDGLTRLAGEIWDNSGGDAAFQEAALSAVIAGDLGVQVREGDDGPMLQLLDPSICYPEFDPHNYKRLVGFTIAYGTLDAQGGRIKHYETWKDGQAFDEEDRLVTTYDESLFSGLPFTWIRNDARLGQQYGMSDLAGLFELTAMFDHLARKDNDSVDYWLEPSLVIKGAPNISANKIGGRRAFHVPQDGDIGFITADGERVSVGQSLDRIYNGIVRETETPRILFGDIPDLSDVSGTALKMMFAPLITKIRRKQSTWGPPLERAMWQALRLAGAPKDLKVRTVDIVWPDPTPTNDRELRDILEIEKRLGASPSQVLGKLGYTSDQVKEAQKENAELADEAAQRALTRTMRGPLA